MNDLDDFIPIDEDTEVTDLNFQIIFLGNENLLDFSEDWKNDHIRKSINEIKIHQWYRLSEFSIGQDYITVNIKQITPDAALQDIVEFISGCLSNTVDRLFDIPEDQNKWDKIEVFSIGSTEKVKEDMETYIRKMRDNRK